MQQQAQTDVVSRLDRLDERMTEFRDLLLNQRTVKDIYTTAEVAMLRKREWGKLDHVQLEKWQAGQGLHLASVLEEGQGR